MGFAELLSGPGGLRGVRAGRSLWQETVGSSQSLGNPVWLEQLTEMVKPMGRGFQGTEGRISPAPCSSWT